MFYYVLALWHFAILLNEECVTNKMHYYYYYYYRLLFRVFEKV